MNEFGGLTVAVVAIASLWFLVSLGGNLLLLIGSVLLAPVTTTWIKICLMLGSVLLLLARIPSFPLVAKLFSIEVYGRLMMQVGVLETVGLLTFGIGFLGLGLRRSPRA